MKIVKSGVKHSLIWSVVFASLALSACGSSSNTSVADKSYKVTISNLTANQPLAPVAAVIHKATYHLYNPGTSASVALENLAEGGSNQQVLDEANAEDAFIASQSGAGIIPPGASESIELLVSGEETGLHISIATMLVNTNDAFAAVASNKIDDLQEGESFSLLIPVWDAGTEANSEAAGTIPGPADGGEGFNASRTGDVNFVAIHQGVVTIADGLATSVLGESHRFNNPGALLSVERLK